MVKNLEYKDKKLPHAKGLDLFMII